MLEDVLQESEGQHDDDVCWLGGGDHFTDYIRVSSVTSLLRVEVITSLVSPHWTHDNSSQLLHMGLSSEQWWSSLILTSVYVFKSWSRLKFKYFVCNFKNTLQSILINKCCWLTSISNDTLTTSVSTRVGDPHQELFCSKLLLHKGES